MHHQKAKSRRAVNYELSIKDANNDQEKLIRKFCKKVKKLGIIEEHLEKAYYVKPSVKKRRKKLEKLRLAKRQQERQSQT